MPALQQRPLGANVLVVGGRAKSIGVYAAAIGRAMGAEVDYMDHNQERLALAAKAGAIPIEGRIGSIGKKRYDVTVDATNKAEGLLHAIRTLANHGICSSASIFFQRSIPVPMFLMYSRGLTLRSGLTNSRSVIPEIVKLIATKKLRPEELTSIQGAFDDAHELFRTKLTKVIVTRSSVFT